jgi:hypothetical protein
MKSLHPQFTVERQGLFDIVFTGNLKVSQKFPVYTVAIHYRGDARPLARVIQPLLVDSPPHFFKKTNSLCLYHPRNYRWTKERLIGKDIVSWTAAWIYFYEVWLQKKIWIGPEAEHDDNLKSE